MKQWYLVKSTVLYLLRLIAFSFHIWRTSIRTIVVVVAVIYSSSDYIQLYSCDLFFEFQPLRIRGLRFVHLEKCLYSFRWSKQIVIHIVQQIVQSKYSEEIEFDNEWVECEMMHITDSWKRPHQIPITHI